MRKLPELSLVLFAALALLAPLAAGQSSPASADPAKPDRANARSSSQEPVETLVRVRVPSTDSLRRMSAQGVDVTHEVAQGPNGTFDATVIVPGDQVESLAKYDATVLDTYAAPTRAQVQEDLMGRGPALTREQKQALKPPAQAAAGDKPAAGRTPPQQPETTLTVLRADRYTSPDGTFLSVEVRSDLGPSDVVTVQTDDGETFTLSPFVDRGVYLYHRMRAPVATDGLVDSVTATSSDQTSVQEPTTPWATGSVSDYPAGFQWGFTDEGYVDATQANAVMERLAAEFPDLVDIIELPYDTHGYNLPEGNESLDAPESYPHDPFTVKALRIGADRSGAKTGVLLYSQEHAREWVTSLVALETAQRLLHNYGSDPTTTALVNDLDIFIVPMINPDGVAFSLYDDFFQRTNMNVDGCDYGDDPTNAGIDVNRNFSEGSLFDGFVGASDRCTSSVYAGAAELSESESSNEVWLTETYPNIEFAMNTHSFGGYFMWSPAAYMPDRTTLPRPDLATEQYFFTASETILSRIKEFRGTVVWPGRTGPVVDVLYSAAGNSGDEHFYEQALGNDPDIYAWDFEVGVPLWDEETQSWDEAATGFFWPDFETEGFAQAMEFANGWYGILEVARAFALDDKAPVSESNVDGRGTYSGPVDVFFETSEPATVYYTTDGSRPDWDSPTVQQAGVRGGPAPVELSEPVTVLQWFSVDEAGNVEGGYDPDGIGTAGLNREVIKIED